MLEWQSRSCIEARSACNHFLGLALAAPVTVSALHAWRRSHGLANCNTTAWAASLMLKRYCPQIERLQKRAKQAEAELRQHQAAASSAERHSGPATAHGSATSSQGVPSPPNTLGQGWDPEEVVQKLLAALVDQENRSRQWADERQQLQV